MYQKALNAQTPMASNQNIALFLHSHWTYSVGSKRDSTATAMHPIMIPEHHLYARRKEFRLSGSTTASRECFDMNMQMKKIHAKKITAKTPWSENPAEAQSPALSIGKNATPTAQMPAKSRTRSSSKV